MATLTAGDPAAQVQNNNVVFALLQPTGGPKAYRLEIDESLADNAMTNLFLLSLSEMLKITSSILRVANRTDGVPSS